MSFTKEERRHLLRKERRRLTRRVALALGFILLFVAPSGALPAIVSDLFFWLGYAAVIACVLGRAAAALYVGGRKNDRLVAEGPFSVVRNPLYVSSFLGAVGVGFATGMACVTLGLAIIFALYHRRVVAGEEAFLTATFGEDYRAYAARVPRWWPNLSLWRSPETVSAQPYFVLKTIGDSSWFLAAPPAFWLIGALQHAGFLPVLLRVP